MDIKTSLRAGEGFLRLLVLMAVTMCGIVNCRTIPALGMDVPCMLESCDCFPNNLKVICQQTFGMAFQMPASSEPALIR